MSSNFAPDTVQFSARLTARIRMAEAARPFPLVQDAVAPLFGGNESVSSSFDHTHFLYRRMASLFKRDFPAAQFPHLGATAACPADPAFVTAYRSFSRRLRRRRALLPHIPVRTRIFDEVTTHWLRQVDAHNADRRAQGLAPLPAQVVILGAGFDSRAYRLPIFGDDSVTSDSTQSSDVSASNESSGAASAQSGDNTNTSVEGTRFERVTVFEVDQHDVLAYKQSVLSPSTPFPQTVYPRGHPARASGSAPQSADSATGTTTDTASASAETVESDPAYPRVPVIRVVGDLATRSAPEKPLLLVKWRSQERQRQQASEAATVNTAAEAAAAAPAATTTDVNAATARASATAAAAVRVAVTTEADLVAAARGHPVPEGFREISIWNGNKHGDITPSYLALLAAEKEQEQQRKLDGHSAPTAAATATAFGAEAEAVSAPENMGGEENLGSTSTGMSTSTGAEVTVGAGLVDMVSGSTGVTGDSITYRAAPRNRQNKNSFAAPGAAAAAAAAAEAAATAAAAAAAAALPGVSAADVPVIPRASWLLSLLARGYVPSRPTLFLAEGLFMYLRPCHTAELFPMLGRLCQGHPLSSLLADHYSAHASLSGAAYYDIFCSGLDREEVVPTLVPRFSHYKLGVMAPARFVPVPAAARRKSKNKSNGKNNKNTVKPESETESTAMHDSPSSAFAGGHGVSGYTAGSAVALADLPDLADFLRCPWARVDVSAGATLPDVADYCVTEDIAAAEAVRLRETAAAETDSRATAALETVAETANDNETTVDDRAERGVVATTAGAVGIGRASHFGRDVKACRPMLCAACTDKRYNNNNNSSNADNNSDNATAATVSSNADSKSSSGALVSNHNINAFVSDNARLAPRPGAACSSGAGGVLCADCASCLQCAAVPGEACCLADSVRVRRLALGRVGRRKEVFNDQVSDSELEERAGRDDGRGGVMRLFPTADAAATAALGKRGRVRRARTGSIANIFESGSDDDDEGDSGSDTDGVDLDSDDDYDSGSDGESAGGDHGGFGNNMNTDTTVNKSTANGENADVALSQTPNAAAGATTAAGSQPSPQAHSPSTHQSKRARIAVPAVSLSATSDGSTGTANTEIAASARAGRTVHAVTWEPTAHRAAFDVPLTLTDGANTWTLPPVDCCNFFRHKSACPASVKALRRSYDFHALVAREARRRAAREQREMRRKMRRIRNRLNKSSGDDAATNEAGTAAEIAAAVAAAEPEPRESLRGELELRWSAATVAALAQTLLPPASAAASTANVTETATGTATETAVEADAAAVSESTAEAAEEGNADTDNRNNNNSACGKGSNKKGKENNPLWGKHKAPGGGKKQQQSVKRVAGACRCIPTVKRVECLVIWVKA